MVEAQAAIASAVVLPETEDLAKNIVPSLKRSQPSRSPPVSKRRRISQNEIISEPNNAAASPPQESRTDRMTERRKHGQLEERKRGQRLFGALLGTLSQSSSSTAEKRRADIENKQRTKLKLQTEEEDEKRKARMEALINARREEQKGFDHQSMRSRHSISRAQAHFLQTKTEPRLYYKPWELLPNEEGEIKKQIVEVEAAIDQELKENELTSSASPGRSDPVQPVKADQDAVEHPHDDTGQNGKVTGTESPEVSKVEGTDLVDVAMSTHAQRPLGPPARGKENHDDTGEVVEGEEDTVIY